MSHQKTLTWLGEHEGTSIGGRLEKAEEFLAKEMKTLSELGLGSYALTADEVDEAAKRAGLFPQALRAYWREVV